MCEQTEKTYVQNLQIMCDDYLDKLVDIASASTSKNDFSIATVDEKSTMSLSVIYGIFGNIREILKVHSRFFGRIKASFEFSWLLLLLFVCCEFFISVLSFVFFFSDYNISIVIYAWCTF